MMLIREEKLKLIDTRSFAAEDITAVWEWLDSFDSQPMRPRIGVTLERGNITFRLEEQSFRDLSYTVAKCSDGRELLSRAAVCALTPFCSPNFLQLMLRAPQRERQSPPGVQR